METRQLLRVWLITVSLLLTAGIALSMTHSDAPGGADKVAVVDGHVVHDAGLVWHHVSNWGLIGSAPGVTSAYSDAPSAMWPIGSGNEYLWAAGLWVGARVGDQPRVSTGAFGSEFLPTSAAADTIHRAEAGAVGGNRYPWPDADDDGDGLEDEDLPNGLDDDGDGLVDEDFAAFGDQQFVGTYNDLEAAIQAQFPDHTPLGINVVQRSIQWGGPLSEDFIGFDFTITNVGVEQLDQVYLGLFSDSDIGPRGLPGISDNDFAGFVSTMAATSDGSMVPVRIAYMYDGPSSNHVDGYVGWVLCGHSTDPTGVAAPIEPGVTGFQCMTGNAAFELGGDPVNDAERYQLLSAHAVDPDVPQFHASDYRVLMSSGPFTSLAPGESLSYQVALVLGTGLDEMIANAAEAVATYRGKAYDRDGDPGNGAEFVVPWLRAEDAPVSASSGRLVAEAVTGGGVRLLIETNRAVEPGLTVERTAGPAVPARRWSASELEPLGAEGHAFRYRLLDADPVGWPRQYRLTLAGAGDALVLAETGLEQPMLTALALRAGPNPFNPRVTVDYDLPRPGRALLQVFDLQGRLVRTLLDGDVTGGAGSLIWKGDDDAGRSLASGVYQLRLAAGGALAEKRVTLIR